MGCPSTASTILEPDLNHTDVVHRIRDMRILLEFELRAHPNVRKAVRGVECRDIDSFRTLDRECPLGLWRKSFVDDADDPLEELDDEACGRSLSLYKETYLIRTSS